VSIKESDNRSCGCVPAVYSGSDQAFPPAVPHNLYQARVAFVHILVQVEFQLHWKKAYKKILPFNDCGKINKIAAGFDITIKFSINSKTMTKNCLYFGK